MAVAALYEDLTVECADPSASAPAVLARAHAAARSSTAGR